ncbi:putative rna methyltransferase [Quercus suber]|uniref:Rna methyltransferase n=1 Tax=Quercus suber TaxID=58331 RepID=A0AAW0KG31_QUESU
MESGMVISIYANLTAPLSGGIYTGQSVLFLRILTEGKKCSLGVQLIVDECIQKLNHYCTVDDVQLRSNPRNANTAMMNIIRSDDWVTIKITN